MAATYTLISSNVLTGTAASVTFSSIPSTYTDLIIKSTTKTDFTDYRGIQLRFNGSSATNYSYTIINGDGSTATSSRGSALAQVSITGYSPGTAQNGWSNNEIYIPNYLSSTNKTLSASYAGEDNATASYVGATAGLWSLTNAITSITLLTANNFVSGSSFYLYGIKNS